eukprot:1340461-Rhodomonas_salina.1
MELRICAPLFAEVIWAMVVDMQYGMCSSEIGSMGRSGAKKLHVWGLDDHDGAASTSSFLPPSWYLT